ncbi:uncharacterized protein LOC132194592 [Neocloeon triangulifer]|uniref:uncharacterized protein LOC132194592 n=1 Tax=Neocloeon triangulifer TaxID=2078957 RepID=UPI00286EC80E|nr:uncharacterized protein LOC132194592 [Neocloeon triangulifer]
MSMTCARCSPLLCLVPLLFALTSAAPLASSNTSSSSSTTSSTLQTTTTTLSTTAPTTQESTGTSQMSTSTAWPEYEQAATTLAAEETNEEEIRLWPGYWIKTDADQEEAQESSNVDYRTEVYHIADLFSTANSSKSSDE